MWASQRWGRALLARDGSLLRFDRCVLAVFISLRHAQES